MNPEVKPEATNSNEPAAAKGEKKDFSTAILERKKVRFVLRARSRARWRAAATVAATALSLVALRVELRVVTLCTRAPQAPNRLIVDDAVTDDNSVVALHPTTMET